MNKDVKTIKLYTQNKNRKTEQNYNPDILILNINHGLWNK